VWAVTRLVVRGIDNLQSSHRCGLSGDSARVFDAIAGLTHRNWSVDQKNAKLTAISDENWKFMVIASYAVRWRQSGKRLPPRGKQWLHDVSFLTHWQ
jgi:hypothetical protein